MKRPLKKPFNKIVKAAKVVSYWISGMTVFIITLLVIFAAIRKPEVIPSQEEILSEIRNNYKEPKKVKKYLRIANKEYLDSTEYILQVYAAFDSTVQKFYLYQDTVAEQEKIRKQREIQAEFERQKRERREDQIDKQFNAWDGSHIRLTKWIKRRLKDPKSYEHIETRYEVNGNTIRIGTRYRARNGFGGMTIGAAIATVNVDGTNFKVIMSE